MRFFRKLLCILLLLSGSSSLLLAAGKEEGAIAQKVPVENLTGFSLFMANLYNNQRLTYAIIATLLMAVIGMTIAFGTDIVLKFLGLDVSKISHHE